MINFDLDALNNIIESEKKATTGNFESNDKRTKTSFLKQGTHKIRFLIDPKSELFRQVVLHNVKFHKEGDDYETRQKCLCPNHLNRINSKNPNWAAEVQAMNPKWKEEGRTTLPDCEICGNADKVNNWREPHGPKYYHMIYIALYDTTDPDDYWAPDKSNGNLYAVIANNKCKAALMDLTKTMSVDAPDFIVKSLNPTLAGGLLSMTVTRGQQGSVNITFVPGQDRPALFAATDTPETNDVMAQWKPLSEVYIDSNFNFDDYTKALELSNLRADEYLQKIATGEIKPPVEDEGGDNNGSGNAGGSDNGGTQSSGTSGQSAESAQTTSQVAESQSTQIEQKVTEEVKSEPAAGTTTVNLEPNQVKMSMMDRVITLPEVAVREGCWAQYSTSQPKCISCACNIECMTELSARRA